MDNGPIRVAQICASLQQAIRAEAKTAPITDVELGGAVLMFLKGFRDEAPESWPQLSRCILMAMAD